MEVPANLITTSWNLMQLHNKPAPPSSGSSHPAGPGLSSCLDTPPTCANASQTNTNNSANSTSGQKVYTRHMQLQDKLLKVRIDAAISADGLAVENEYSKEVGQIEMNRYRALNSCPSHTVKTTINTYYDRERMSLADNTEKRLDCLIEKAESMRQAAHKANTDKAHHVVTSQQEPALQGKLPMNEESTQGASLLLQPVDNDIDTDSKMNAVRKLKFNISNDHMEEDEEEDNDYLNGSVNSEDFEIDEIDVETVDIEEPVASVSSVGVASSPVGSSTDSTSSDSSDLLQQCIAESGLLPDTEPITSSTNSVSQFLHPTISTSSHLATDYIHQSTSSTKSVSQCLPAVSSTSSHTTDYIQHSSTSVTTSSMDTQIAHPKTELQRHSAFKELPLSSKPFSFGEDMFGTPQHSQLGHHKFAQPDQINLALSEIGKLCGGPSVTFTPELRREITGSSFTPDATTGLSPFASLNNSINGYPSSTSQPSWNSPMDSVSKSSSASGSGQKRKRTEDETEQHIHGDGHMTSIKSNELASTRNSEVSSATGPSEDCVDPAHNNNAVFRTHRMLTAEATTYLNHWYNNHVQYPYPNDEEVKQLSQLTGITGRQVKKWMANKRVRCFNTLSITGNQHPIKFKYNRRGRKKKPAIEKDNCDSTTQEKRLNYSLLSEEAKLTLNNWYEHHQENPYPSEEEKLQLATACNITVGQVKSWFANKRNRTNNTRRQVPNYFINKFPEYSNMVQFVGQKREEARMIKRRKLNQLNMYIQPNFYF